MIRSFNWVPAYAGMTIRIGFLLFAPLLLSACNLNRAPHNLNMVVSVSTDGHYAIATNTNKQAVLWDLQNHSYKIISSNANIYSAYFVKNTEDFIYQNNANNEVFIENINGKLVKAFNPGFPTYGEVVTSNLEDYFGAEVTLTLHKINLITHQDTIVNQSWCGNHNYTGQALSECIDFRGSGQSLGLQFTPNEKLLVGANFNYLFIWNVATGKGIGLTTNVSKTVAAINPDGEYLVTGDIMSRGIKYTFTTQHASPLFIYKTPFSQAQEQNFGQSANEILALKYIANNQLLVIRNAAPQLFNYATLYNTAQLQYVPPYEPGWIDHELLPVKYLPLISNADTDFNYQKTWPLTDDQFSRDQAIDTSPSAHILVMAMDHANGIIVYHYDPKTQTLTREWAGVVKPWWKLW